MARQFIAGNKLGAELQHALGIEGAVQRIVLDCPAHGTVTVYVQRLVEKDEAGPILGAIEIARQKGDVPQIVECNSLEVDEKGRVNATLRTPKEG